MIVTSGGKILKEDKKLMEVKKVNKKVGKEV